MKVILKLLPLFLIYILLILLLANSRLEGDEIRFFQYAKNLAEGFYTSSDNPVFHNGPAYPMLLAPFVVLGAPILLMVFLNAFLLFFSVVFLYKTVCLFAKEKIATIAAYAFGLYYPMWRQLDALGSEPLAIFLICGFLYFFYLAFQEPGVNIKKLLWPSLFLGSLILTKFFFGNVATASLIFSLILYASTRRRKFLKMFLIMGMSFLIASPYLGYTYSKTGRLYYWSTNSGEVLYWVTSPVRQEYGQWFWDVDIKEGRIPNIDPRHHEFFSSITDTSFVKRNDILLEKAKEQIKAHPEIYLFRAFVVNPFRLFFDYPNSYKEQNLTIYFYMFYHMFLIVLGLFSLYPAWVNRRKIPIELYLLLGFILIYLGGSILVIVVPRYLVPAIPFMILWITYIYTNFVEVKVKGR